MKNIRVMIVEDDPIISFLHKEVLKSNKIVDDPLVFMNGKEALDFILNDAGEKFYLVLLDINMPVMNGWQFLDRMENEKEIACRMKVAIVTSSINPSDKVKAKEYLTVDYYLSKPLFDFTEIREAIEKLKILSKRSKA